jgi:uncharacterized protein YaaQ
MRRFAIFLGCSALALAGFSVLSEAQTGGGGKGGGGGFGFGGFGRGQFNPQAILQLPEVKKELDLSEEQSEKLPGAIMKAVADVLNDKQMKRFRQIELQVRGTQVFVKDEQLRKDLKITESQTKSIEEILDESRKEIADLMKDGGFFKKGNNEKIQGINKEAKEKVMNVLTSDQKKSYKQIVGEEFKFEERKGFGGKKDNKDDK